MAAPDSVPAVEGTGLHTPRTDDLQQRATVLAIHLGRAVRIEQRGSWVLPVGSVGALLTGGMSVALGAFPSGLEVDDPSAAERATLITGGLLGMAGGIAGLLASDPEDGALLGTGLFAHLGAFGLAFTFRGDQGVDWLPMSIGSFTTSALMGLSLALRTPTPRRQQNADYERIRTPGARRKLDARQLAAIERRFRHAQPAIPRRYTLAPFLFGTGVTYLMLAERSATALADEAAFESASDRSRPQLAPGLMTGFGIAAITMGALAFVLPGPVGHYEQDLGDAGLQLEWTVTPGALGVRGTY